MHIIRMGLLLAEAEFTCTFVVVRGWLVCICVALALQGCGCSIIVDEKNKQWNEEDNNGAWGAPIPFLGSSFVKRLMGEKRYLLRDWERAQFQEKQLDNDFKMGQEHKEFGLAWKETVMQQSWHAHWDFPLLLSIISGLALFIVVLIWLKNQMSSTSSTGSDKGERGDEQESTCASHSEGGQWIYHPVIQPVTTEQCETLPALPVGIQPQEEKREPVRIKAKGLLERRGSSASLTIDLLHPSQENLSVTPTRECTAEEYLLSVGNVLSRNQLRTCLKDARSLHKEFWDLPLNHPEKLEIPGSGTKNRYRTIIPNECSRVHLPAESAPDPLAAYINANYIRVKTITYKCIELEEDHQDVDISTVRRAKAGAPLQSRPLVHDELEIQGRGGYDGEEKAFIATQGPMANTVVDFWRMVWKEHSPVIVMITKLMEKSRTKCELYFPIDPGVTEVYGDISVTVTSIVVKDGYVIRHFILQKGDETHRISHFWFDSWPDHKTPANAHSLLCLAKDVESYRFRDPQRGSTSSWPHSPKPVKSEEIKQESTDLLSPCPEAVSPSSLKETSPILNFGHLEFREFELEKDLRSSPKSDNLTTSNKLETSDVEFSVQLSEDTINLDITAEPDKPYTIVPVLAADNLNSPTFYNRSLYGNDDVFQVGSLPQKSPVQSRIQFESIRSRSVEVAPTCGIQRTENKRTTEVFDFDKLSIAQESLEISTDESNSSEDRKKFSSETSDNLLDSFEKKIYRGVTCTSSPNWTSEASPNLTQSFEKSTSKLSVDSLSWGGLDAMSPNLTNSERSPNRTQSSIESPMTQSSSDSKRWPRSSDSSKQWTRSSQSSSGWAQSSEDSPWWLEKEPESASHLRSPRDWFDRSPLLNRRSREGSISFLWSELPRGPATGPVIVHCSAGIGRTGCFIAICVGVNQLLGENNVDILGIVCRMRYDRGGMVQTAEQYEFIHRALALFERSLPDQSGE